MGRLQRLVAVLRSSDQRKRWLTWGSIIGGGGLGLSLLILVLGIVLILVLAGGDNQACQSASNDDATTSTTATAGGAVVGEWTQPGTTAYNNAKSLYDGFTKAGMSGAAAAGFVGWVNTEGGFTIIDRAEGHFGNDESTAGISAGVEPTPSGNYAVGGGGIFQFTPYTKFAPKGDQKWLDGSAQAEFVIKSIKENHDWNASMDLTGGQHTFNQFAHESNPEQAVLMVQAYERGNTSKINQSKKQSDARKAYELFGGDQVQANDSALGTVSSGADKQADSDDGELIACSSDKSEGNSTSGAAGGEWAYPFASIAQSGPTGFEEGQQFGTTSYARAGGNFHDGVDFGSAKYQGSVLAVHGGTVYQVAQSSDGRGVHVDVKSSDGYYETYQEAFSSLSDVKVKVGDTIKTGDQIGTLDTSHLHLGISKTEIESAQSSAFTDNGTWLNPVDVIKNGGKSWNGSNVAVIYGS